MGIMVEIDENGNPVGYLSMHNYAKAKGLSYQHVSNCIRENKLSFLKIGNNRYIPEKAIIKPSDSKELTRMKLDQFVYYYQEPVAGYLTMQDLSKAIGVNVPAIYQRIWRKSIKATKTELGSFLIPVSKDILEIYDRKRVANSVEKSEKTPVEKV